MGKRDKERVARIQAWLEQPRSLKATIEAFCGASATPKDRLLVRTKEPSITSWTEIKTCNQIMSLLANPKMPKHIIADKTREGMHKVVAKLARAGETSESIVSFYWAIPEFRQLWSVLGYNERIWREVVNDSFSS